MPTKVAAIIQARVGSTRYPGKVLHPLCGVPMIEHIIKRVQRVSAFERIILAVPDSPKEDALVAIGQKLGIESVKGPEKDVLQRFILAGDAVDAEHICRICSDNPLIDPALMASLARHHLENEADYTITSGTIPNGTAAEMVRFQTLKEIASKAEKKPYREHVTTFFHDHPDEFKIIRVPAPAHLRGKTFRLTVDTDQDFQLIEKIYSRFYDPSNPVIDLEQVIPYLEAHPEIAALNAQVIQKDWRQEI